jgi:hypothetical protein
VELRTWQIKRVADFHNAGDLLLMSTIFPDGTVAALEEMVGSHGGLGGEQTDAFILHPEDMDIPATRNSKDVKAILDARRGLPGSSLKLIREPVGEQVNPWSAGVLGKGIGQINKWFGLAAGAIGFNRESYHQIAVDAYMTGPALLIALISQVLQSLNDQGNFDPVNILARFGLWLLAVLVLFITAIILRGKADFTTTFRVVGFAQAAHIIELLGFIPVVGPLARFIALVLAILGTWMGTATANEFSGWRSILLPLIFIATLVISIIFLIAVVEGTTLTINSLLIQFGLAPSG